MGGPSTMGGPSHSISRTTYATTQSSQTTSICADTTSVPRPAQNRIQVGTGKGLERKKANARGTPFVQKGIVLLVNCHLYQVTRDHTVLPHLLLLLEKTEGLQLVLVFTLILLLEPKYLMYVHLTCLLCFSVYFIDL